jgi:hypothetical protein
VIGVVCLGMLVGLGTGCSSQKSAVKPAVQEAAPAAQPGPTDFGRIYKVQPGMTLLEALREMGPPRDMKGNTYYYKGQGRIVFAGKKNPTDKTKVVKVEPDVMEDGIAP